MWENPCDHSSNHGSRDSMDFGKVRLSLNFSEWYSVQRTMLYNIYLGNYMYFLILMVVEFEKLMGKLTKDQLRQVDEFYPHSTGFVADYLWRIRRLVWMSVTIYQSA
ncbi:hypothetical protein VN97_g7733 [Penicillium thymicola]|uniref:Uncharacterized protein n=1 Tax=Penicillium thymicola TaxID=293382 RepID=A0AAI9X6J8_PENTH|nr:hypothetical protein VN97_g7733 [Penicillium thymicola]